MTILEYLNQLVKEVSNYVPTISEQHVLAEDNFVQFIFQKLTTQKFRTKKLSSELETKVKDKITYCVDRKLPIHITIPFGGYKNFRFPSYPNIDWSEVFNIIELREYITPIATCYPYGATVHYFSDEILVSRLNNLPQKDLDTYNEQFKALVTFMSAYFPKNSTVKFNKIRDFISSEEFWGRIDKDFVIITKKWETMSPEEKAIKLQKSLRNFKSPNPSEQELTLAAQYHDAFIMIDWDVGIPWAFDTDMIAVGFRYTNLWGIPIKSSRSSVTQFWVGTGMLLKQNEEFLPTIATLEQWKKFREQTTVENIDIFPKQFLMLQKIELVHNGTVAKR